MNAAAISHYANNVVRYDPHAAQQRLQLQTATQQGNASSAEQTLEGELLNKSTQQGNASGMSEEEFLARHQAQRARSTEGYRSQIELALAAYQTAAQLTHPADVDQIGYVDVYV